MKLILIIHAIIFSTSNFAQDEFISLIRKGINNSPELSSFQDYKRYEETLALSSRSKLFLPSLNIAYKASKDNGYYDEDIIDSNLIQLNANYSLFSFGSDYNAFKSQQYSFKAFNAESNSVLIQTEYKITKALLDFIRLKQELNTLVNIIHLKESLYIMAKKKYKNGSISKSDLIRVKIDLADTKSQKINKRKNLLVIKNTLKSFEIIKLPTLKKFPWTEKFQKTKLVSLKDLKLNEAAFPTVNKLKFELEAAIHDKTSTEREYLGNFSLNFSRNIYKVQDHDENYGWSGSIIYTLPLFENFEHKARVDRTAAKIINKRKELGFVQKNLQDYIKEKKENLNDLLENFLVLNDIKKDLSYLLKNLQNRYRKGVISTTNLFIQQDQIFQTQNRIISANYILHLNYLETLQLYGKSITQSQNLFFN